MNNNVDEGLQYHQAEQSTHAGCTKAAGYRHFRESWKGYRGPKLKTEAAYDSLVGVKLG